MAKYNWILSLDADEAIDEELKENLLGLDLADEMKVYEFRFKNFLGSKWLRFGEWGNDKHIRLFNRTQVHWNDAEVHESLVMPVGTGIIRIKGNVLHKTASGIREYEQKMIRYATLNAEKYFKQGKSSTRMKMILSAIFSFIKNYFLKLGFLDGSTGYHCARINAEYTFLKYKKLKEFSRRSAPDSFRDASSQSQKTS